MTWLLWREYRLNRWILITGGVLVVLPFVSALLSVSIGGDRSSAFFAAYIASTVFSAMMIALLSGNSIAKERADRSVEFGAFLPLTRWRRLCSKLFLPLTTVAVLWIVNLLVLMPAVETWPAEAWPTTGTLPERFQWSVLLATAAFLVCSVGCLSRRFNHPLQWRPPAR